jgi:hypothetical protein
VIALKYSDLHQRLTPSKGDFMIQTGLASKIHFHGKQFPWFVSDATQKDWDWLIESLSDKHVSNGVPCSVAVLTRFLDSFSLIPHPPSEPVYNSLVNGGRSMKGRVNSCTNNILFGAQASAAGNFRPTRQTSFPAYLLPPLFSSKGI